ncbi:nucleoporin p58/p45-like [Pollicipes pollicipes]|uniref:nucleoporin p58/p45-like n=1 Tax=Pollicipes pollicipes TaxID=41117 RepID=UPI001884E63C|nr:nucleoporin p58/p45-like [Pollicipes pollicipes]
MPNLAPGALLQMKASTQAPTGFSLGAPQATSQASTGFSLGAPQAAATPFVGLGGKQLQLGPGGTVVSTGGLSTNFGKADGKSAKETPVPDEVAQTVAAFQKHVQEQKSEYEQISRHSWAPVQRVREETGALRQLLAAVEASVQRHATAVSKHKHDVGEALKSAEVAQRTSEISPGLQYENLAPQELFERLVQQYEASMVTYKRQIDQLERLLAASDGASFVSPEELMSAIRQLHETFVWLAGHLQTVHEKVQVLKDHYLAYRRSMGGDIADVFGGDRGKAAPPPPPPQPQPGPSPFALYWVRRQRLALWLNAGFRAQT